MKLFINLLFIHYQLNIVMCNACYDVDIMNGIYFNVVRLW